MPSTARRFADVAGDIWQHMVRNSDWEYDELLCADAEMVFSQIGI